MSVTMDNGPIVDVLSKHGYMAICKTLLSIKQSSPPFFYFKEIIKIKAQCGHSLTLIKKSLKNKNHTVESGRNKVDICVPEWA